MEEFPCCWVENKYSLFRNIYQSLRKEYLKRLRRRDGVWNDSASKFGCMEGDTEGIWVARGKLEKIPSSGNQISPYCTWVFPGTEPNAMLLGYAKDKLLSFKIWFLKLYMFNKEMRSIKRAQGKMPTQMLNVCDYDICMPFCTCIYIYTYNFV